MEAGLGRRGRRLGEKMGSLVDGWLVQRQPALVSNGVEGVEGSLVLPSCCGFLVSKTQVLAGSLEPGDLHINVDWDPGVMFTRVTVVCVVTWSELLNSSLVRRWRVDVLIILIVSHECVSLSSLLSTCER